MTKVLITLLFKQMEKIKLGSWRPITLLNVTYKIYTTASQMRLQPVPIKVISAKKTSFLPL